MQKNVSLSLNFLKSDWLASLGGLEWLLSFSDFVNSSITGKTQKLGF